MSSQDTESRGTGKVGWFVIGALAASLAFLALMVVGDLFNAVGSQAQADDQGPALVIEGK